MRLSKKRCFFDKGDSTPQRFSVFFEKLSNLWGCKVRFPMRRQPEIAISILFRRCLRPQARFGAQPPLAAALSAEMRRNSARLIFHFRRFLHFYTLTRPRRPQWGSAGPWGLQGPDHQVFVQQRPVLEADGVGMEAHDAEAHLFVELPGAVVALDEFQLDL